MGLFIILQTIFMGGLLWISQARQFAQFLIVMAILKMIMASYPGCAVLVALDIFGGEKNCIVFDVGGALALGGGKGLSAAIMTLVESWIVGIDMIIRQIRSIFAHFIGLQQSGGLSVRFVCFFCENKEHEHDSSVRTQDGIARGQNLRPARH